VPTIVPSSAPTATPTILHACPAGKYIGVGTKEIKEAVTALSRTRVFSLEQAKRKLAALRIESTKAKIANQLSSQLKARMAQRTSAETPSSTSTPSLVPTAVPTFPRATLSSSNLRSYLNENNDATTATVKETAHTTAKGSAVLSQIGKLRLLNHMEPIRFEEGGAHPHMVEHRQKSVENSRLQSGAQPQVSTKLTAEEAKEKATGAEEKAKKAEEQAKELEEREKANRPSMHPQMKPHAEHPQQLKTHLQRVKHGQARLERQPQRGTHPLKAVPHSLMPRINPRLAGRRRLIATTATANKNSKDPAWLQSMERQAAVHDEIVRRRVCLTCPAGYYSLPAPGSHDWAMMMTGAMMLTSVARKNSHSRRLLDAIAAAVGEEQIRCEPCAPGRYSSTPGASSAEFCIPCLPGHYGDQEGMTEPKCSGQCKAGRYGAITATSSASTPVMNSAVEVEVEGTAAEAAALAAVVAPSSQPLANDRTRRRLDDAGLLGLANLVHQEDGAKIQKAEERATERFTKEQKKVERKESRWKRLEERRAVYKTAPAGPGCTGPCPAGRFGSVPGAYTSDCEAHCPSGYFSAEGWVACKRCTAGQYISTEGRSACIACAAGKYMPTERYAYQHFGIHPRASAKQEHTQAREQVHYTSTQDECTNCPRGYGTGGSVGQISCGMQPTFVPTTRPTWPLGLPRVVGGVIETPQAQEVWRKTSAAANTKHITAAPTPKAPISTPSPTSSPSTILSFAPTSNPTATHAPTPTPTLWPSSMPTIAPTEVANCPPGEEPLLTRYFEGRLKGGFSEYDKLRVQQHHRSDECVVCEAGLFSGGSGKLAHRQSTGTESCRKCVAGRFGLGGSRSPMCDGACPAGRYGLGGDKDSLCASGSSCPAGRYGDAGCSDPDCDGACAAGRFGRAGASNELCDEACPPGKFSAAGSTICTGCAPGHFSDKSGRCDCVECPAGQFQRVNAATSCELCAPGLMSSTGAGAGSSAGRGCERLTEPPSGSPTIAPSASPTIVPSAVAKTATGTLLSEASTPKSSHHRRRYTAEQLTSKTSEGGFEQPQTSYATGSGINERGTHRPASQGALHPEIGLLDAINARERREQEEKVQSQVQTEQAVKTLLGSSQGQFYGMIGLGLLSLMCTLCCTLCSGSSDNKGGLPPAAFLQGGVTSPHLITGTSSPAYLGSQHHQRVSLTQSQLHGGAYFVPNQVYAREQQQPGHSMQGHYGSGTAGRNTMYAQHEQRQQHMQQVGGFRQHTAR
jgi:hypothetical protein